VGKHPLEDPIDMAELPLEVERPGKIFGGKRRGDVGVALD
jgi:hypothetical protein